MDIQIFDEQSDLAIQPLQVKALVKELLAAEKCSCDEVALHFVSREKICELHEIYFGDPTLTDCISFPIDSPSEKSSIGCMLGDVFVSPFTALRYAEEHQLDPYLETTLYIIHGILHLLGYDDLDSKSEEIMRAAEARNLSLLNEKGLCLKSP